MKQKFTFKVTLWWVIGLLLAGAAILVFAGKEPRISLSENRMLAGFPSLSAGSVASGEFMTGFEDYLSDSFFGRDSLVAFSDRALGLFSARSADDVTVDIGDAMQSEFEARDDSSFETAFPETPAPEVISTPAPQPTAAPLAQTERVSYGSRSAGGDPSYEPLKEYNFWMVRTDGSLTQVYSYEPKTIETLMKGLNGLRGILPQDGTVHFVLIPVAQSANRWTRQRDEFSGWRSNAEEYMQALAADGVYIYNASDILAEGLSAGDYLYYRSDHHWTPRGAYAVFSAMMKAQGLPVTDFDDYSYQVRGGYLGSIYQENHSQTLAANPDDIEVMSELGPVHSYIVRHLTEQSEVTYMAGYSNYLAYLQGTLTPWRRLTAGFHTGRKCLLISDSFGNCFAPYLLPYYDEVHMVDLRKGNFTVEEAGGYIADFVEHYGIDDMYVVLSTASGLNYNYTQQYLTQYLGR